MVQTQLLAGGTLMVWAFSDVYGDAKVRILATPRGYIDISAGDALRLAATITANARVIAGGPLAPEMLAEREEAATHIG